MSAQGKQTRQVVNQGQVCCAQHNYCILQTARQTTCPLGHTAWNFLASYDLKVCQYDVNIPSQISFKIFLKFTQWAWETFLSVSKKKNSFSTEISGSCPLLAHPSLSSTKKVPCAIRVNVTGLRTHNSHLLSLEVHTCYKGGEKRPLTALLNNLAYVQASKKMPWVSNLWQSVTLTSRNFIHYCLLLSTQFCDWASNVKKKIFRYICWTVCPQNTVLFATVQLQQFTFGKYFSFCSWVPFLKIWFTQRLECAV